MECRLCAKNMDNFFSFFETEGLKMEIVSIVSKHFWFEPKPDDNASHSICGSCWITTKNFHELYLLVEKIEKNWAQNLHLIKEDPYIDLADYDDNQNIQEESSINVNQTRIFSRETKLEMKDIKSAKCNSVISKFSLKAEKVKYKIKKREPAIAKKPSLRKSIRNLKKDIDNSDNSIKDYLPDESLKKIGELQNIQCGKISGHKNKGVESDALIAKFMKIVCNFCLEEQKNFTSYKRHCVISHGQQAIITCCEKNFFRKTKLVEHIERHVEPEKYKCNICGNVFKGKRNLQLHMKNKHEEHIKPYNCSHCGKAFRLNAVRMRHELIHMPEEERKFKCSQCDKNFPAKQSLKYHIRAVHDAHYAGVCDICGKTYNNRGELKQHHLKIHKGIESKFKCKYCNKDFKSKYTYNEHKFREHENTNPNIDHKCPLCDKTSKNLKAIKSHIQFVHKAKAKFNCKLCTKVFKFELALKEHMAAHTGQPLYSCPHCPRTFTHNSNMHHHRKVKHRVEFEEARQRKDKKETWREITGLN